MTEALLTKYLFMFIFCHIMHKSGKICYRCIMSVVFISISVIQKVNTPFEICFGDIERMSGFSLVIIETKNVDVDLNILLNLLKFTNFIRIYRVLDLI